MEMSTEKGVGENQRLTIEPKTVLFAGTPKDAMTIGVVCAAEPSSLALLAAGVAGMAARRARRERKANHQPAEPAN